MQRPGLERDVVDPTVYERTVGRFPEARHRRCRPSPSSPTRRVIPDAIRERLAAVDPDAADPANLFRVHWYNGRDRRTRVPRPGARRPAARR